MRIDKFLKVSRIIKKREVSKELASLDRLYLNGRPCKGHKEVNVGDIIKIEYGHKTITVKVKEILESAPKDKASDMYEVIESEL